MTERPMPSDLWAPDGTHDARLVVTHLIKGLGPALQIAEGYTVDLPDEVHFTLDERTYPTWPTTWFVPNLTGNGPFRDAYSVMYNWGANHGTIGYGHIGHQLITLCSMLRIPVYMHNVADERIFRPSAWNAFGTSDLEGADYDLRTPLHLAAAEGQERIVQLFIDQGVELSPRDRWGNTPLDEAKRHGHARVAELLRKSGERHVKACD